MRVNYGICLTSNGLKLEVPLHFQSRSNPMRFVGDLRNLPYFMVFAKEIDSGKEKLEEILKLANGQELDLQEARNLIEEQIPEISTFEEYGGEYLEASSNIGALMQDFRDLRVFQNTEMN